MVKNKILIWIHFVTEYILCPDIFCDRIYFVRIHFVLDTFCGRIHYVRIHFVSSLTDTHWSIGTLVRIIYIVIIIKISNVLKILSSCILSIYQLVCNFLKPRIWIPHMNVRIRIRHKIQLILYFSNYRLRKLALI